MSCGPNIRRRTRPTPTNDGTVLRPTAGCTHSRPRRIPVDPSGRQFPLRIRGSDPFRILRRADAIRPAVHTPYHYAVGSIRGIPPRAAPSRPAIGKRSSDAHGPLLTQREQVGSTPPRTQTGRPAGRFRKCSVRQSGNAPRSARTATAAAGTGRPHPAPNANGQTCRPTPEMLSTAYRETLLGAHGPFLTQREQTCRTPPRMQTGRHAGRLRKCSVRQKRAGGLAFTPAYPYIQFKKIGFATVCRPQAGLRYIFVE